MPQVTVVMTITGFICPIDSLALDATGAREDGDVQSRLVDSHVHIRFTGAPLSCPNGHRWRLDETVMSRIQ